MAARRTKSALSPLAPFCGLELSHRSCKNYLRDPWILVQDLGDLSQFSGHLVVGENVAKGEQFFGFLTQPWGLLSWTYLFVFQFVGTKRLTRGLTTKRATTPTLLLHFQLVNAPWDGN